jgi:hypothetical protein
MGDLREFLCFARGNSNSPMTILIQINLRGDQRGRSLDRGGNS